MPPTSDARAELAKMVAEKKASRGRACGGFS